MTTHCTRGRRSPQAGHFLRIATMGVGLVALGGMLSEHTAPALTVETVLVVDAGNADDPETGYGSVGYEYRIGKYELTRGQYAEFLNAVAATDTFGVYSIFNFGISRSGVAGSYSYSVNGSEDLPVHYVSWGAAARFANWLHNGQPTGLQDASTTEEGAYSLNGATTDEDLILIVRNPGARWFIPSEDEWYKSAYYDPVSGSYFDYPTRSNTPPIAEVPPGGTNSANYNGAVGQLTDVGAYSLALSPYGTFDQGGNLFEWNEAVVNGTNRGLRGGDFGGSAGGLVSTFRFSNAPSAESTLTFRVATVPEPSSLVFVILGIFTLPLVCKRRDRRFDKAAVATALLSFVCLADAQAVTIETVPVGNAGNAPDRLYLHNNPNNVLFGAVPYEYRIGKYEVTVGQYSEFLNAVAASDTYALYSDRMGTELTAARISRSGVSGSYSYSVIGSPNKPVTYVSWGDAARFVNWLHNGQPAGAQGPGTTEDGAYSLNGAVTGNALISVSRNPGARWYLPSEDEWYKAAFHQPSSEGGDSDNYWSFPTRTNSEPNSDQPPGAPSIQNNAANFFRDTAAVGYNDGYAATGSTTFDSTQNYLTDVGAYPAAPSFYGTFDQAGGAWEWNEATIALPGQSTWRGIRGGNWGSDSTSLIASFRPGDRPNFEISGYGFRVATVPEPRSLELAALAFCIAALCWKRRATNGVIRGVAILAFVVPFAADAQAVTIETVAVGNPGNANDTTGFGGVGYEYRMGKYEVSNSQYVEFLNAKDDTGSNPLQLYVRDMGVDPVVAGIRFAPGNPNGRKYAPISGRENHPVNFVSWYSAIRFANWLHNGQASGDTETGAYTLGALGADAIPIDGNSIQRNPGATAFLPSENEWYKAAYHKNDGIKGNYFLYPTSNDTAPANQLPPGGSNSANIGVVNHLTDVGAYSSSASPYGTFDQGGNVVEWNEGLADFFPYPRFLRGGSYYAGDGGAPLLHSSYSSYGEPHHAIFRFGFRVATVPEPSTAVLASLGLLLGITVALRAQQRPV